MKYDIITDIATIENDKDFCYYSIYITLLIPLLLKYLENDGNQLDAYDNNLIYIIEKFLTELNSSNVNSKDLLDKINVEIQKQNAYYELNDLLKNSNTLETEIVKTLNDLDAILTSTRKKGGKKIKNKKYSRGGDGNIELTEPIIDLFGKVSEIIYHIIFNIDKYLITLIKYSTINKYKITTNLTVIKNKLDDLIKLLFKKEYNIDSILDEILNCLKDNQDFSHYLSTIHKLKSSYNKILANSSLRTISAIILAQNKIGTDNVKFIYIYYILYIFNNKIIINISLKLQLYPYTYNSIKKLLLDTLLELPVELKLVKIANELLEVVKQSDIPNLTKINQLSDLVAIIDMVIYVLDCVSKSDYTNAKSYVSAAINYTSLLDRVTDINFSLREQVNKKIELIKTLDDIVEEIIANNKSINVIDLIKKINAIK